ncbi:hypothetical protein CR513_37107, partial [Mucuna pruriens]
MVNEVNAIDNLRLENQLTELTSLQQEFVAFVLPWSTQLICAPHYKKPSETIPRVLDQEVGINTKSNCIRVDHMIINNLEGSNTGRGNTQLKNSDLPKVRLRLSAEPKIPNTTIPTIATTESAIIGKLTIFGGPDEVVGDKQPGVSTYYELQQHAILAKFKCHDPGPQNAGGSISKYCESVTVSGSRNLPLQTIPNPKGNSRSANVASKLEADSLVPQQARSIPLLFQNQTLSARKAKTNENFLKMFRKVEINIPLLDAIKQIPKYVKFLKELCMHKRKKMKGGVELGGIVSALTKNDEVVAKSHQTLPKKCQDPRIFSVPCTIDRVGQLKPRSTNDISPLHSPSVELKPLSGHLKYAYLDNDHQFPHKKAIRWRLSNLLGINPSICMHKILMEEEARPIRLNLTILDMVKKEVMKLLVVRIIYPISDSQWVSPVQVVPKKYGMTIVKNQHDELVSIRIQNSWKLNQATRKDHFPLPFIEQVLEKLAGKSH